MNSGKIAGFCIAGVAVIASGFYWVNSEIIARDYASAVAQCETDATSAAAKIRALDSLKGIGARPRSLAFDINLCLTGDGINSLRDSMARHKQLLEEQTILEDRLKELEY